MKCHINLLCSLVREVCELEKMHGQCKQSVTEGCRALISRTGQWPTVTRVQVAQLLFQTNEGVVLSFTLHIISFVDSK